MPPLILLGSGLLAVLYKNLLVGREYRLVSHGASLFSAYPPPIKPMHSANFFVPYFLDPGQL